jgi:hypothetical protein
MRTRARAINHDASDRHYAVAAARTLLGISGALISIIGFVLIVSGAVIAKHNRAGAWTYTALIAATFGLGLSFVGLPAAGNQFFNADAKGVM